QQLANDAAQTLEARIEKGENLPIHWTYYPNRPLREQALHEIKNSAGEVAAVVTRNSYGCQVLNTARVMFVDVDFPESGSGGGFFKKLFGKSVDPQTAESTRVEDWMRNHPDWGWRVYRTRAGVRLLATHGLIDADSTVAEEVFVAMDSDPLYRTLCKMQ